MVVGQPLLVQLPRSLLFWLASWLRASGGEKDVDRKGELREHHVSRTLPRNDEIAEARLSADVDEIAEAHLSADIDGIAEAHLSGAYVDETAEARLSGAYVDES